MRMVLFIIGGIAIMAGAAMIGFGIPINEFSFGNTLIVAGTVSVTGGLILVGLAAVVGRLQRIAEILAARTPVPPSRPVEAFEVPSDARAAPAPVQARGRIPPPPSRRPDQAMREPQPVEPPIDLDERAGQSFAPAMRNPEAAPVTVDDEVSLSPQYPVGEPAQRSQHAPTNGSGAGGARHQTALDASWRDLPPPSAAPPPREAPSRYFDNMWPAAPGRAPAAGEPKPELPSRDTVARAPKPAPRPASQPRPAAILKSGVVDGMAYTLYVDGSIEAELPQGTLRFASIDELRSHLEKNP